MYRAISAIVQRETYDGTVFTVLVPGESLTDEMKKLSVDGILKGELRIDDGRHITTEQRRKAWATLGDISLWNGDEKEVNHWYLKTMFRSEKSHPKFSLSDCSITTARNYISYLLDFCLAWDVPLTETLTNRTDDIDAAIYSSLKHRRCIICGLDGEPHHWDVIGMGRNRNTYDDSAHRKLCLCRIHHTEAHDIGRETFEKKYHVYGIIFNEKS
ncbi:MAG: putative HNHc nuclease [Defluviitaleaceae bacterium]|nr:putative HNHc nuclease [Defluviitaleaceae bacterium]MCL2261643.1 putative HNHc nuclease [Defluviitaleaceae bacterium]